MKVSQVFTEENMCVAGRNNEEIASCFRNFVLQNVDCVIKHLGHLTSNGQQLQFKSGNKKIKFKNLLEDYMVSLQVSLIP